jgi:hypothetical protein
MSAYGNVPDERIKLTESAVDISHKVIALLPETTPPDWLGYAFEQTLNAILEDSIENGTDTLDEDDIQDLYNLNKLAMNVSIRFGTEYQDVSYRVILKNLLHDWVENWGDE